MSGKTQLPPEIAEYWGKLTPQQQSLMFSRIKALASGNEYQTAMEQSESVVNTTNEQSDSSTSG